jgi:hypothetical protein
MKVDSGILSLERSTPPIVSGKLSSSAAFTCGKPTSAVGTGLGEGTTEPDGVDDPVAVAVGPGVA